MVGMGQGGGMPPAAMGGGVHRPPPRPPMAPPAAVPEAQQWTEHKAADGRPYWYNGHTKESVWVKPAALKSHAELLMSTCPWKEFTNHETGRKYYYNSQTKKSLWVKPPELAEIEKLAGVGSGDTGPTAIPPSTAARPPAAPPTAAVAGVATSAAAASAAGAFAPPAATATTAGATNSAAAAAAAAAVAPAVAPVAVAPTATAEVGPRVYETKAEAQEAFRELLRDKKVSADWNWDRVRRVVNKDPRYEALRKEGERKQVFNAWKPIRRREQQEEERVAAKLRLQRLKALMMVVDEIGVDSTYHQAAEILRHHEYFKAIKHDRDRQDAFTDVVREKSRLEKEAHLAVKRASVAKVKEVLATLPGLGPDSRIDDVLPKLKDHPRLQPGGDLADTHDIDLLDAFVDHTEGLSQADNTKREEAAADRRHLRHAREGFEALLSEMARNGGFTANSLWKQHYDAIAADPRYDALVSICRKGRKEAELTPLDLFKIHIDELKDPLREGKRVLRRIMADVGYTVTPSTDLKDFHEHLCGDTRYVKVSSDAVRLAHVEFVREAEAAERRLAEEAERASRRRKGRFVDMLHRGLRKYSRDQPWSEVAPLFERYDDFGAVEDPELREALFNEVVASDPWASMPPPRGGYDDDRDRERDRRYHRSRSRSPSRRSRHRSWSPSGSEDSEGDRRGGHGRDREYERDRDRGRDRGRDRDRDRRKKRKKEKKEKKEKVRRSHALTSAASHVGPIPVPVLAYAHLRRARVSAVEEAAGKRRRIGGRGGC